MDKEKTYTEEELAHIEDLASKYNFKEMGSKLGFSENNFLKLRKNHPQFNQAVNRGIAARGAEYKNRHKKRLSESTKKGRDELKMKISLFEEIDPNTALKKFKEEFEANKRKRDLKELKDIELI